MRIAICDDEREDIKHLADFFDAHLGYDVDWEPYPNGEKLVADYTRGERYDALFIDMEMDDMNGIETAKAVRALDRRVVIIFVTSHRKYMQESFDCLPLQFIVKPASQKELEKALRTIQKRLDEERVAINFNDNKRPIRLYCDEILYCESKAHWIELHTQKETYRVRRTMAELETALAPGMFVRTHKAFLVNLSYFETTAKDATGKDVVRLHGCAQSLPLSRFYKAGFMEALRRQTAKEVCL